MNFRLLLVLLFTVFCSVIHAEDQKELPRRPETFDVAGGKAFLYASPKPAESKPWLWYAPTLKGVSLAQRKLYFDSFMSAGISIVGHDLGEVRGSPASTEKFNQFYNEMVKRGYSPKPILLGQSRGGMMMLAWAMRHPDKVGAFVGIYPVCNLASWPLKNSKKDTLADFGMTEETLTARLKEFNPIDNLQPLADHKVPVFIVHGDSDQVVPFDLNTGLLKQRYEAAGGSIIVKVVPGEGHKVSPSFFESHELVDFVLQTVR